MQIKAYSTHFWGAIVTPKRVFSSINVKRFPFFLLFSSFVLFFSDSFFQTEPYIVIYTELYLHSYVCTFNVN